MVLESVWRKFYDKMCEKKIDFAQKLNRLAQISLLRATFADKVAAAAAAACNVWFNTSGIYIINMNDTVSTWMKYTVF